MTEWGAVQRKSGRLPWRLWKPWAWGYHGEEGVLRGSAWTRKGAKRSMAKTVAHPALKNDHT